ncbi:MAG: hypothetical protein MUE53_07900, partial [Chitinophagales bacterium]|nr:hypothetical protein [Chitinophagales bacterium]
MLYVLVILIYALILLVIPYLGMHLSDLMPMIKDPQAQAQLSVPVEWTFADFGYALFYMVLVGGVLFYWRSQYVKVALVATPLFVLLLMIGFAPRVERYVQGPLIDFYKSKKGLDVDIQPLYIKSYACYFYADKRPFENDSFTHLHFLYGP